MLQFLVYVMSSRYEKCIEILRFRQLFSTYETIIA
jgi:hypothetical protein